jgi:hypothetical protein
MMTLAIIVAGCQRDDELQMERTFAGVGATKAVTIDFGHMGLVNALRSEFVGNCMIAAGYQRARGCADSLVIFWEAPEVCFDNASHLVPTKYQEPDRKLFWEWQWLRWKVGI